MMGARWRTAQEREREYWEHEASAIGRGEIPGLDWYRSRADNFRRRLSDAGVHTIGRRVVEVGSGPVGLVNFLEAPERFAVDPLNDYYASKEVFAAVRDPDVHYSTGRGEQLEFATESVDALICENVLDHVEDPLRAIGEFARVLKPSGVLFLRVEVFGTTGAVIHTLLSRTRLDPLHPHTFTPGGLRKAIHDANFLICHDEVGGFREARRKGLASGSWRARALAFFGWTAVIHTAVAQRASRTTSGETNTAVPADG